MFESIKETMNTIFFFMSFTMKRRFFKTRYKCWNKALTLLLEQSPVCRPQSPSEFLPEYGLEIGESRG